MKNIFLKLMNNGLCGKIIKKILSLSPKLLFKDTDTLIYKTKTQVLYKYFFDFSDYPGDLKFFDCANS